MNYYETGRTNYVKWKSVDDLETFCGSLIPAPVFSYDPDGSVALLFEEGVPSAVDDTVEGFDRESEDIDLAAELSMLLEPGQTLVMQASGHEGLRYVSGYAWAVNHRGDRVDVSLNDIYEKAKEIARTKEADDLPIGRVEY